MKKALIIALGLAFVGSAFAQTNTVLSRNAVGYVKVDLVASNKLHLIRNDFVGIGSSAVAISNTLATLPVGSKVLLFNESAQAYNPAITKTAFGWGPAGSNVLPRGVSFFLTTANSPTNVPSYPLYIMGEVPDAQTAPNTAVSIPAGFGFKGYPYPVAQKWTNTALSVQLGLGAKVIPWDSSLQTYGSAITKTAFGWGPAGNALVLNPGQGFLISASAPGSASEVKPYTWP